MFGAFLYIIVSFQVNVMVFLSERQECWRQEILYVNQEGSDCSREIRCTSEKEIPYGSNDTLCLVRLHLNINIKLFELIIKVSRGIH